MNKYPMRLCCGSPMQYNRDFSSGELGLRCLKCKTYIFPVDAPESDLSSDVGQKDQSEIGKGLIDFEGTGRGGMK